MSQKRVGTSARSDLSETDFDDSELAKLQRQLRLMKGDRVTYNNRTRELLRKQAQEIEKLEMEQRELNQNLLVCMSSARVQQEKEDTQSLQHLLRQKDTVEDELQTEYETQNELQKEISNTQSKIVELRKGITFKNDSQKSELKKTQTAINTLEYKLERASTRFNDQLTQNNQLKVDLQNLYIDRACFQQLYNTLNTELLEIRKKISDIIIKSTAAYDGRLEAHSKMAMMNEKAVKDHAQHNAEIKELERVIAHEISLKEFMSIKCNERSEFDTEHGTSPRPELKEQKKIDTGEEAVALEEFVEKIKIVTGEEDLQLLATKFIQDEDRNFALLNFVSEQSNEAEALRDQITNIQKEMEKFQAKSLESEKEHQSLLKEMEEQKVEIETKVQDIEGQATALSDILDGIKEGVDNIVTNMECDRSAIEDKLGSTTGITDNNIMSYLGLVEQSADKLLIAQAFLHSKDPDKHYDPKELNKFMSGKNQQYFQTSITSMMFDGEQSSNIDEDERPLSEADLRKRIIQGVLQRESVDPQATVRSRKHSVESSLQ